MASKDKWAKYPNNTVSASSNLAPSKDPFIHVSYGVISSKSFSILHSLHSLSKSYVNTIITYRLDQYWGNTERMASICRTVSNSLTPGGYWLCLCPDSEVVMRTLLAAPESAYREEDVSLTVGETNTRFMRVLNGLTGPDRVQQLHAALAATRSLQYRVSQKREKGWVPEPQVRYCLRMDALLEHLAAAGLHLAHACSLLEYVERERFPSKHAMVAMGLTEGPLPSALSELLGKHALFVIQKPAAETAAQAVGS